MTLKILYGEDDEDMQLLVKQLLEVEGFRVDCFSNGQEVIDQWRRESYDCVLLDVMMPVLNGLETCRRIRRFSNVPIILLTARGQEDEIVLGLEAGADDYIQKPFKRREFIARIRVAITRAERMAKKEPDVIEVGNLRLEPGAHRLTYKGKRIDVSPLEFQLLYYLMRHPGAVFSKEELLQNVWGYPLNHGSESIDLNLIEVTIRRLRKKVEEDPSRPRVIQTVWGSGYRLGN